MEGIAIHARDENLDINIATSGTDVTVWFIKDGTDVITGNNQVYYLNMGVVARQCSIRVDETLVVTQRNGKAYKNQLVVAKPFFKDSSTNEITLGGLNRDKLNWSYIKLRTQSANTQIRIYAQG